MGFLVGISVGVSVGCVIGSSVGMPFAGEGKSTGKVEGTSASSISPNCRINFNLMLRIRKYYVLIYFSFSFLCV